jgi:hypothetical protein
MSVEEDQFKWSRVTSIHNLYIIARDGNPLYCRSYDDSYHGEPLALPTFVRNSVILFHSSSSTSSERVYTLEHDGNLWAYAFFQSFALVTCSQSGEQITPMKNMLQALGRSLSNHYGDLIRSWNGSMSEISDLDTVIDQYFALDLSSPSKSLLNSIDKLIDSVMERPEISFVGVFDSSGKMLRGNVPEVHLFRLEVEISQGSIKPVMDIAPTSIRSGDHMVQMFRVQSLTIAVSTDPAESPLHAISVAGEFAHSLDELLSD